MRRHRITGTLAALVMAITAVPAHAAPATFNLKSNVTINLRAGSKIIAAGSGMDKAESTPFDQYQDFGNSHFRNALMWDENVENVENVEPADSRVEAGDDAVTFKNDYALGRTFPSEHNVVRDSTIISTENNAVQFDSETCGSSRDIRFSDLTITGASRAGLGIVSMDGATIEDVSYTDITLTRTGSPIYLHVGKRSRCPGSPPAGKIRNVTLKNITGTNLTAPADIPGDRGYTSTLSGRTESPIENITFGNVRLTVPGGHPASDANRVPPESATAYPPRTFGVRPAYGFWLRHTKNIRFVGVRSGSTSPTDGPRSWPTTPPGPRSTACGSRAAPDPTTRRSCAAAASPSPTARRPPARHCGPRTSASRRRRRRTGRRPGWCPRRRRASGPRAPGRAPAGRSLRAGLRSRTCRAPAG